MLTHRDIQFNERFTDKFDPPILSGQGIQNVPVKHKSHKNAGVVAQRMVERGMVCQT